MTTRSRDDVDDNDATTALLQLSTNIDSNKESSRPRKSQRIKKKEEQQQQHEKENEENNAPAEKKEKKTLQEKYNLLKAMYKELKEEYKAEFNSNDDAQQEIESLTTGVKC